MKYTVVLSIAGSDSSGGAGIQADIKTISALGCYAATAITAVTVQNTLGVEAVEAVSPEVVADQISAVMDDLRPSVVKVGMVGDVPTIRAIASTLRRYPLSHVIIDPVMVSTSGAALMDAEAVEVFSNELLSLATLVTPNIPETIALGWTERNGHLHGSLPCPVLVKGGHEDGVLKSDRLYSADGVLLKCYEAPTILTRNTHGTGCTLSSAIASLLALGYDLEGAVGRAKEWLGGALSSGAKVRIGHGYGPINHLYNPQPMKLSRLQFITHQTSHYGYVEGAKAALAGGCRWVQLRMKSASDSEVAAAAEVLLPCCRAVGAVMLIDDRVEVARAVGVDGVHLGRNDMPIAEARAILGTGAIIGGTANTFADVEAIAAAGADYIGCGPYRFTTTKDALSPVLGTEGYRAIIERMRSAGISLPIVAIGGIKATDVPSLVSVGVDGIAVSGAILAAPDPISETRKIINELRI